MPMNFPTMDSLKNRAKQREFRQPEENETEKDYRSAFAAFMYPIDMVESMEIDSSKGWDQWNEVDKTDFIDRL